jgi:hypothetical protein
MKNALFSFLLMAIVVIGVPAFSQDHQFVERSTAHNTQYSRWYSTDDWSCEVRVLGSSGPVQLHATYGYYPSIYNETVTISQKGGRTIADGLVTTLTWKNGMAVESYRPSHGDIFQRVCLASALRDLPTEIRLVLIDAFVQ